MRKRFFSVLFVCLLITALLAGCGSASMAPTYDEMESVAEEAPSEGGAMPAAADDANAVTTASEGAALPESDKIIYSAYAEVETLDFDSTVEAVYALITRYGGFIESSSVTGNDYYSGAYGGGGFRSASFSFRVPREHYADVYGSLETLGNIPYKNSNAENITSQYVDTESRLSSLRTQEKRLLELLERADTVEDMITIESRLAEVRYQIEGLTTTLRSWDSLISYSSVTLNILEVSEVTEQITVPRGYWEEVGAALSSTIGSTAGFFKGLLKYLIAALPIILVLGVITALVLILYKRSRKRFLAKMEQNKARGGDMEGK